MKITFFGCYLNYNLGTLHNLKSTAKFLEFYKYIISSSVLIFRGSKRLKFGVFVKKLKTLIILVKKFYFSG